MIEENPDKLIFDPTAYFSEEQKKSYAICLDSIRGLNYQDAEEVIMSLISVAKKSSLLIL
jgi:hypothetical protein